MVNKIDPKTINVPNICFSLTDGKENDNREERFAKQRLKRGFDDSETWSLSDTIANFSIPRLKRFKKIYKEKILSSEEKDQFIKNIDKVIDSFKLITKDNGARMWTEEEEKRVQDGLGIFSKIFLDLWW